MRNRLPLLSAAIGLAFAAFAPEPCGAATLKTLASFAGGVNGATPLGGLVGDAAGNLFGTTQLGGTNGVAGTVFVIVKTFSGYQNTPTILASLDGTNFANPQAGLIIDFNGNLFGTTDLGGSANQGTVFELARTANGYASTPTNRTSFAGQSGANPQAPVIADANGNLFGTTDSGGQFGLGTVFATPTTGGISLLLSLNGASGANPRAGLIMDANGNLFGTASAGGIGQRGTVFEIVKTDNGYNATPTLLAAFDGTHGRFPLAGLTMDAAGNLFGTTYSGGTKDLGTVFELAKNEFGGYASTPTVLYNFCAQAPNCTDGRNPQGELIIDADGNLFGTTSGGGDNNYGVVFEIAKTSQGYASTPTTLVSFNSTNGAGAQGHLIADTAGNLFGTTQDGGPFNTGTVYQITNSGFVPALVFAGTPGTPHCYGESVLALLDNDHDLDAAAQALGFDAAEALQAPIQHYCTPSRR